MGTDTQRLQDEIKGLIKQLGWSQKRFARELQAMDDDDADRWATGEEETSRYEERVKKQLTRPTVAPELLRRYLQQLQSHEAFANLDVIVPYFEADDSLPRELLEGMTKISAMLDDEGPETSVAHERSKTAGSKRSQE
ncbi:hypothetical protein [Pseudomonas viridiflava]|uniref:hypothetical protein n=1 Tax=Pseudomonas viridiflava TaxID=33069 RepID=UPI000F05F700|nr:hypothetical protein [Pseudomonas viridiflava]